MGQPRAASGFSSAFPGREIVDGHGSKFVEDKLTERDERHERMGDTRYVVELQHQGSERGDLETYKLYIG